MHVKVRHNSKKLSKTVRQEDYKTVIRDNQLLRINSKFKKIFIIVVVLVYHLKH
jgi:hypothetical protein